MPSLPDRATGWHMLLASLLLAASLGCGEDPSPLPEGVPPSSTVPLVAASAPLVAIDSLPRDPRTGGLPGDSGLAAQILYGLRLMNETPALATAYVGNRLTCTNCHLNAGQREGALPLVGVAGMFPLYRPREARLVSLEDRIRGCFARSMNGTPPPYDSPELLALSAYITWLSEGYPVGASPPWRETNRIARAAWVPIEELDARRGRALFEQHCPACHGLDGQGVDLGIAKPGPLWGADSWNDGAGAARVYTLAGFIRHAMPLASAGVLTDEEAQLISAYINSHERPVYEPKDADYPGSTVPVDAVYDPRRYGRNPFFGTAGD